MTVFICTFAHTVRTSSIPNNVRIFNYRAFVCMTTRRRVHRHILRESRSPDPALRFQSLNAFLTAARHERALRMHIARDAMYNIVVGVAAAAALFGVALTLTSCVYALRGGGSVVGGHVGLLSGIVLLLILAVGGFAVLEIIHVAWPLRSAGKLQSNCLCKKEESLYLTAFACSATRSAALLCLV